MVKIQEADSSKIRYELGRGNVVDYYNARDNLSVPGFGEKTVSFLQNYLVFFLLGILCSYVSCILFIKLNFPYDSNHINVYGKVLPPLFFSILFCLLIKKENINHNYAGTLFYFGNLLIVVYFWKISTVLLPLGAASQAYTEYWWRIVPLPESYKLSLYNMLYEIEKIPIIGTVINILIGIGICFALGFLLMKLEAFFLKKLFKRRGNVANHSPNTFLGYFFLSLFQARLYLFLGLLQAQFMDASLDWGGDHPMAIVKAYHDIYEKNTVYLTKEKIKQ